MMHSVAVVFGVARSSCKPWRAMLLHPISPLLHERGRHHSSEGHAAPLPPALRAFGLSVEG